MWYPVACAFVVLGFGLRSGLCFADALFKTVFAAVAAAIQFFGTFSFFMAHDTLPKEYVFHPLYIYPANQDVQLFDQSLTAHQAELSHS